MAYKIQHLKISGILDQSIAVVKDNFGLLFTILLYAWIPLQLVSAGLTLAVLPHFSGIPTPEQRMAFLEAQAKYSMLFLALMLIQMVIVLPLTNAAVIHAIAERYLGRDVTAAEALRRGLTKIMPLIWTAIVAYLAVFGGLILLIIPGLLFALWFALAQHTVILENLSGVKALSRSKALVRPNLGTMLVLGLLVGVAILFLQFGARMIPQRHISALVQVLVAAGITLFSTATFVIFYFSCRCAVENFDLEHLAESIDSGEAAPERIAGVDG